MTYQIIKNGMSEIYADAVLRFAGTGSSEIIYALSDEPGSRYIFTADEKCEFENVLSECIKTASQLGLESVCVPVSEDVSISGAISFITNASGDSDIRVILTADDDHETDLPEDISSGIDEYLMSKLDSFESMNFALKEEECSIDDMVSEDSVSESAPKAAKFSVPFLKRAARAKGAAEPCESAARYDKPDDAEFAVMGSAPMAAMSCAAAGMTLDERVKHLSDTWQELLLNTIDQKGFTDAEVYKKANVDRKLFSKIRSNPSYQPKKITAVAFALALELNLDESRDFIARAGYAFSESSVFDLIIMYFIENKVFDIYRINLALFEHDQPTIGG